MGSKIALQGSDLLIPSDKPDWYRPMTVLEMWIRLARALCTLVSKPLDNAPEWTLGYAFEKTGLAGWDSIGAARIKAAGVAGAVGVVISSRSSSKGQISYCNWLIIVFCQNKRVLVLFG